jgi:hypothetical protein
LTHTQPSRTQNRKEKKNENEKRKEKEEKGNRKKKGMNPCYVMATRPDVKDSIQHIAYTGQHPTSKAHLPSFPFPLQRSHYRGMRSMTLAKHCQPGAEAEAGTGRGRKRRDADIQAHTRCIAGTRGKMLKVAFNVHKHRKRGEGRMGTYTKTHAKTKKKKNENENENEKERKRNGKPG